MRIVVIGAGLFGVSSAYYLAERGHEVRVLDQGDGVASECSHANGGIVHAGNAAPWSRPGVLRECLSSLGRSDAPMRVRPSAALAAVRWGTGFLRNSRRRPFQESLRNNARLAAYSLAQLVALRQRLGLEYDASSTGCMTLYRTAGGLHAALRECEALAAEGVRCELLQGQAIAAREPALAGVSRSLAGALYYPDDESGDARTFADALASRAQALGAEFRLGTRVNHFAEDSGRITGVVTDHGVFRGDAYVLAAGSHSPGLVRGLGLRLPIQPIKGYSITLPCADRQGLPAMPLIDTGRRLVLSVLGTRLRVAGFAELAGHDAAPDPQRIRVLFDMARSWFPTALDEGDFRHIEGWAGLRPTTIDGRPLLGGTPIGGLFLATGAGHLGWTFAAGAGCLVADAVEGRRPQLDPVPFSYQRFSAQGRVAPATGVYEDGGG